MDFLKAMQDEVRELSRRLKVDEPKAFVVWFATIVFDLDEDEAKEGLLERANDKGIDFFWVDEHSKRVVIAQCKYSSQGKSSPREGDLEKLFGSIDWLTSPGALKEEGRPELVEASEKYCRAIDQQFTTELWFVYCGSRKSNIEKRINVYNNEEHLRQNRRAIHCDLSTLEKYYREFRDQHLRVGEATIQIDTKLFETKGRFGTALVVSIPASALVDLYQQFGDLIFARDVRMWLGARQGSVNAKIIETLQGEEKANFWAYNNGITFVCEWYDYSDGKVTLHNFSIVNGCQTTFAIVTVSRDGTSLDDVSVLARIIASKDENIVSRIILYNNSQNPIRIWELRANDPIQSRLKRELNELREPVFYEVRRGEWRRLARSERSKYRTRIRFDRLAQYIAAFEGIDVHNAYVDKARLFEDEGLYKRIFRDDLDVKEILFIWIFGEYMAKSIDSKIQELTQNLSGSEQRPEDIILKRGGRLYALGVAGQFVRLRNRDYRAIIRAKSEEELMGQAFKGKLQIYVEQAILVYQQAVLDLLDSERDTDLNTLIRRPDFFSRVSGRAERIYKSWRLGEQDRLVPL